MPGSHGIGESGMGRPLEAVPRGICRRGQPPSGMGFRERAVCAPEVLHRIDYLRRLRDDDALVLDKTKIERHIPTDDLLRTVE